MHQLKLFPYKMGSESAKALSETLDIMRVKPDGAYVPKIGNVVVNWGNGAVPAWMPRAQARNVKMLNKPDKVSVAGNKLSSLRALKAAGVATPDFTTDVMVAKGWVRNGDTVVERHNLRGNSGEGIRIVNLDDDEMPSTIQTAPLYTMFIPKTAEFRVHVFRGEVIDYIEKKKVAAERRPANFNKYVSSVHQGWVFARNDIRDMTEVRQIAIKAVAALGLDFGAVDIIYYEGKPYVLEVNTAPGLNGTTLVRYANAFRRYMGVADLAPQVVQNIIGRAGENNNLAPAAPIPAAVRAQVADRAMTADEIVLRMDRPTALKLKQLFAAIN